MHVVNGCAGKPLPSLVRQFQARRDGFRNSGIPWE
jgi:hypothetical protein